MMEEAYLHGKMTTRLTEDGQCGFCGVLWGCMASEDGNLPRSSQMAPSFLVSCVTGREPEMRRGVWISFRFEDLLISAQGTR